MLPPAARLRRSTDFRLVLRRGARAGRRRLVVHALVPGPGDGARAGLVVNKAVGNAVVRHRVARRLRHLVAARLGTLPAHCALVVRALPPAAAATSAELAGDLDSALAKLALSSSAAVEGVRGQA